MNFIRDRFVSFALAAVGIAGATCMFLRPMPVAAMSQADCAKYLGSCKAACAQDEQQVTSCDAGGYCCINNANVQAAKDKAAADVASRQAVCNNIVDQI